MSYVDMVQRSGALQSAFTSVARIPKPVVAAITGYALGGGCELALCADVRFAAEDAVLGQPEILLGIIPGAAGTQNLPRAVGQRRAKEIILTGRPFSAQEALDWGVVNKLCAPDALMAEFGDDPRMGTWGSSRKNHGAVGRDAVSELVRRDCALPWATAVEFRIDELVVDEVEDPGALLDERHVHPQRRGHRRVLETDHSAADHGQRPRQLREPENAVRVEDGAVVDVVALPH